MPKMICKNIHYLHTMKWRNDEGGGFAWEVMNTMTSIMKVRLARKYDHLKSKKRLNPDQLELVSKLHDGTLEKEAARLTKISGHGRFKRRDGTYVDIGGSTGGFTRTVLYDWTPPNLDDEDDFQ